MILSQFSALFRKIAPTTEILRSTMVALLVPSDASFSYECKKFFFLRLHLFGDLYFEVEDEV